jgi:hypothetical protein
VIVYCGHSSGGRTSGNAPRWYIVAAQHRSNGEVNVNYTDVAPRHSGRQTRRTLLLVALNLEQLLTQAKFKRDRTGSRQDKGWAASSS